MAGFCHNSRRWLDFLFENPKSCPYDKNGTDCTPEKCGYYEDKPPSNWYKEKMKILKQIKKVLD